MTYARWPAVAIGVAVTAAVLVVAIQHAAARHYRRVFGWRIAATTASYLAAVTPPARARAESAYDVGRLLTNSRAVQTLPGWSSDVEVYHGTAPLVDATRTPLSVDVLAALEDGPLWRRGAALVPLRDRTAERVVGAVAVRPRPWGRAGIPWVLPMALVAVIAATTTVLRQRPLGRYAAVSALLGLAAFADVHSAARRSTDRWLSDTRLVLQEAAIRLPPPRARVALHDLAPVARGGELVAGEPAESAPRRIRVDGARRAVIAVLIGPNRWAELRTAPAEAGVLTAFVLLVVATLAGPAGVVAVRWAKRLAHRRELGTTAQAWGFIGPVVAFAVVFSLGPLAVALYGVVAQPRMFAELMEPAAWGSIGRTALYALYVPVAVAVALGLALILQSRSRGLVVLLLVPFAVSPAAGAVAWGAIYDAGAGVLWPFDPLTSPNAALPALMVIGAGPLIGAMVIVFLAALQRIPRHYIEAARIEGAGAWRVFWRLTLPLLRPVLLLGLVTGIVAAFHGFTAVYVLTAGGPEGATDLVLHRVYRTGAAAGGSAVALLTGTLLLLLTWAQVALLRKSLHA